MLAMALRLVRNTLQLLATARQRAHKGVHSAAHVPFQHAISGLEAICMRKKETWGVWTLI